MVGGGVDIAGSRCGQMGGWRIVEDRVGMRGGAEGNNCAARSSFVSGMTTLYTKALCHDSGRMLVAAEQDYQESQVLYSTGL
jgi:hypothetical protein